MTTISSIAKRNHSADEAVKPVFSVETDPVTLAAGISATRAVYVGTTGTYLFTFGDGSSATFSNIAQGALYPLAVTKIEADGGGEIAAEGDVIACY